MGYADRPLAIRYCHLLRSADIFARCALATPASAVEDEQSPVERALVT